MEQYEGNCKQLTSNGLLANLLKNKASFIQKCFPQAAGAAAETKFYTGLWQRYLGDPDAIVPYTGIGFKPKAIIAFAWADNILSGAWGFATGPFNQAGMFYDDGPPPFFAEAPFLQIYSQAGGYGAHAGLVTMDDDGFTLHWHNDGSYDSYLTFAALLIG